MTACVILTVLWIINIKHVSDLRYFKTCFCDGYSFLIINKDNGEKHFIQGDENLVEFFKGYYSLPCLFHRLLKKEYVRLNDTLYSISYNSHPDCQRIKMELVKGLGIEEFELWKCPEQYRHLLRDERRQELKTQTTKLIKTHVV